MFQYDSVEWLMSWGLRIGYSGRRCHPYRVHRLVCHKIWRTVPARFSQHEGVFLFLKERHRQEAYVCVPAPTLSGSAETEALGTEGLLCMSGVTANTFIRRLDLVCCSGSLAVGCVYQHILLVMYPSKAGQSMDGNCFVKPARTTEVA